MCELLVFLWIFSGFLVADVLSTCECLDRIIILHNIGDFRLIQSPNYPDPYCHGLDCHWHIVAPNNDSKVQFSADNLDLRKNLDQIILYDFHGPGFVVNRTESHRCSGDDLCYYTSKYQYLSIRFKTSNQEEIENFGFQAVVTIRDRFGGSNSSFLSNLSQFFALFLSFLCIFK